MCGPGAGAPFAAEQSSPVVLNCMIASGSAGSSTIRYATPPASWNGRPPRSCYWTGKREQRPTRKLSSWAIRGHTRWRSASPHSASWGTVIGCITRCKCAVRKVRSNIGKTLSIYPPPPGPAGRSGRAGDEVEIAVPASKDGEWGRIPFFVRPPCRKLQNPTAAPV